MEIMMKNNKEEQGNNFQQKIEEKLIGPYQGYDNEDQNSDEENKQNMFDCEIEFPEEWVNVEKVNIQNGLRIEWIKEDQKALCKQYLLCQHCQNILWNPKKCKKCKKHSCSMCFEKLQKCPLCPLLPDQQFVAKEAEGFCRQQLNDLQIYCPFLKRGCRFMVEYSKFEEHINECKFRRDDSNLKYKQISIVSHRYKQLQALEKSHILYSIETHIKDIKKTAKVERRYKQFEILHNYFLQNDEYLGMPLPELPPKKFCLQSLLGSQSNQINEEEIAEIRMKELETYLEIVGIQYKDDKVLQEFLTNEQGFNYLNENNQNIQSLQYLIQKYQQIKLYSKNYFDSLINKGQSDEGQSQQKILQKSEYLQTTYQSLTNYKNFFNQLKTNIYGQIQDIKLQERTIQDNLEKIKHLQNEALMYEFIKRIQNELQYCQNHQLQMKKTLKTIQIMHKFIESIDNCINKFDSKTQEQMVLITNLNELKKQDKNFEDKKECQDIMKSMEIIKQQTQKIHEIAEAESKKIMERIEKQLPDILKMIEDCYQSS